MRIKKYLRNTIHYILWNQFKFTAHSYDLYETWLDHTYGVIYLPNEDEYVFNNEIQYADFLLKVSAIS
jgi:hypothetical protein